MGKASSSKKVARVAGTGGGRTARSNTPWAFVAVLALVVVLGVAGTVTSRFRYERQLASKTSANAKAAPTVGGTPWNEGYVVDICGHLIAPIKAPVTKSGISTDGNGVIHIAPKVASAAGKNATLGVFASSVGMTLSATQLGVPGAKVYTNGDLCSGKAGTVYVKQYPYAGDPVGTLARANPTGILLADDSLVTLAFVPSSQSSKIPAPPASVQAALKSAVAAASPTTTTAPTTTTVPKKTSTTTVPKKTSATTVPKKTSATTAPKRTSTTT